MKLIDSLTDNPAAFPVSVCIVLFLLLFLIRLRFSKKSRIRRKIRKSRLIYYQDFEANWRNEDGSGYKYNDRPGCYVITLYNHRITAKLHYRNYENIYIGQSQNVCQRIHNHLNGKGKGDVYADIKYGLEAYIRIIPCREKKMNDMEKQLIDEFHATDSYNKTRGGARNRGKRA